MLGTSPPALLSSAYVAAISRKNKAGRDGMGMYQQPPQVPGTHLGPENVTSHHITAHRIMSGQVLSHHITSHHVRSCFVASHHITSCHVMFCHISSHHFRSGFLSSQYITSCDVRFCHITSHHITPGQVTILLQTVSGEAVTPCTALLGTAACPAPGPVTPPVSGVTGRSGQTTLPVKNPQHKCTRLQLFLQSFPSQTRGRPSQDPVRLPAPLLSVH